VDNLSRLSLGMNLFFTTLENGMDPKYVPRDLWKKIDRLESED